MVVSKAANTHTSVAVLGTLDISTVLVPPAPSGTDTEEFPASIPKVNPVSGSTLPDVLLKTLMTELRRVLEDWVDVPPFIATSLMYFCDEPKSPAVSVPSEAMSIYPELPN